MQLPLLYRTLFHTGYAVKDVHGAMASLDAKFGIGKWKVLPLPNDTPGRALAFARAGDMIIELVDIKPGEMPLYNDWIPDDPASVRLHHLGHLAGDSEEWDEVARQFESLDIPLVYDADMGEMLRFRYWDTVPLLGHFTEFVLLGPGGREFWDSVPSN